MVIKDKVSAAVYVDATADDAAKFDPASLELLVITTGLLVDTLPIRKKIPSPSLNEASGATQAFTAPPATPAPTPAPSRPATPTLTGKPTPAVATPAPPRPAPTPAAPKPAPAQASTQAVPTKTSSETVAITAQQMREMIASASTGSAPGFNVPAAEDLAPPPPAPPRPAAHPATPTHSGMEKEERATTQYVPPTGMGRGGALGGAQTDEAKKHDEARRFARLLVSEIKLYNESKVDQGRKNGDLYERLKEDIDRSRQMYDERIGEDVRKSSNYFYDELVRILADGKAETLGL
jgi:hypothetical protein